MQDKLKLCIATYARFADVPWREDLWLAQALRELGCQVDIRDWQSDATWSSYDAVFVSSAWNIPSAPEAFEGWLTACERDGKKRLINDQAVLRLGVRKDRYWKVLEEAEDPGVRAALTPTLFFAGQEADTQECLARCRAAWPGSKLVFKPIVSADSFRTYVYDPSKTAQAHDPDRRLTSPEQLEVKLAEIWSDDRLGGVMAQPYLNGVETGEISATFVGLELVGAVQKRPGFGPMPAHTRQAVSDKGTLDTLGDLGARALAAISAQAARPLRSRLDVIPHGEGYRLLELEVVDPNCNFSTLPDADCRAGVARLAKEIRSASAEMRASR